MEAGANGYLAKDSTSQDLCQAAARLARGEEVMMVPRVMAGDMEADGASGGLRRLTPREVAVLGALAGGSSYEAIAAGLDISQKTLRNHISNIYRKLRIYNRAQAVIVAIREGLVDISPR
jgi:two-component system NarL family response regulator